MSRPRDLEDRRGVREAAGVVLALAAADAWAYGADDLPGARLVAVALLGLPAAGLVARLLSPGRGRRIEPVAATAVAGVVTAALAALWAGLDPGAVHAVAWWPRRPGNALDDLWASLEAGPSATALGAAGLLGALASLPFVAARRLGLGPVGVVAASGLGGLLAGSGLLVALRDPVHVLFALPGAALAGALAGAGAGLVAGVGGSAASATDRRRGGLLAVVGLVAALAVGLGLDAARPVSSPAPPDLRRALEACVASLARYEAAHGRYPPSLDHLPDVDDGLRRGVLHGYVVRYATFAGPDGGPGATWGLRADPVPPGRGFGALEAGPEGVRPARGGEALAPPNGWRSGG